MYNRRALVVGHDTVARVLCALLAQNGVTSSMLVSRGAQASLANGFSIVSDDSVWQCAPEIVSDVADSPPFDMAFVTARIEVAGPILNLLNSLTPRGPLVLLGTGLSWWFLSADRNPITSHVWGSVICGITDVRCTSSASSVRQVSGRNIILGPGQRLDSCLDISRVLSRNSIRCLRSSDIIAAVWSRLSDRAPIAAVSVATGASPTDVTKLPPLRRLWIDATAEMKLIGTAAGWARAVTNPNEPAELDRRSAINEIEFVLDLELDITIPAIIDIGERLGLQAPTLRELRDAVGCRAGRVQTS
jgi:2-dehydropantoate 2-reductase